ncbi:hypothetical protein GCM10010277_83310 [Streptomyces longisporoflavus]|nr:hypothetical protein GCM10010277_83310 [Streptomyces longisporoflavus]
MSNLRDGQRDRIGAADRLVCVIGPFGGRVGGEGGQEGQSKHGEGDVPVPGGPVADLVMVETDLALGCLEALLDAPADTGDADQFGQGYFGG